MKAECPISTMMLLGHSDWRERMTSRLDDGRRRFGLSRDGLATA